MNAPHLPFSINQARNLVGVALAAQLVPRALARVPQVGAALAAQLVSRASARVLKRVL